MAYVPAVVLIICMLCWVVLGPYLEHKALSSIYKNEPPEDRRRREYLGSFVDFFIGVIWIFWGINSFFKKDLTVIRAHLDGIIAQIISLMICGVGFYAIYLGIKELKEKEK